MLKFYYNLAPNPYRVAPLRKEPGSPYEAVPANTRKGGQHTPACRALPPNAKVPSTGDGDGDGTAVFDSGAILLCLADRAVRFVARAQAAMDARSWRAMFPQRSAA